MKVEIAKKHGIPFDCQELELVDPQSQSNRMLADPLSLSDYPTLKASRSNAPVRILLKRVVPSDGEGDNEDVAEAAAGAGAGAGKQGEEQTSDYDDESFED